MSASQNHGFEIENLLLAEFPRRNPQVVLPPAPLQRSYTARFDVSPFLDPYGQGIPTSIKTAKFRGPRTLVCLADASRIVRMADEPRMRLMVALYRQEKGEKVFAELREYVLTGEEWSRLCGEVPYEVIDGFSRDLRGRSTEDARRQARVWKHELAEDYPSAMRWNPKIDSKNQRRLQCSVTLQDLEAVIADRSRIKVFGQAMDTQVRPGHLRPQSDRLWGRGLRFPVRLISEARQRTSSRQRTAPVAASPVRKARTTKVAPGLQAPVDLIVAAATPAARKPARPARR